MSKLKTFMAGEILAMEGEKSNKFFVLLEGKIGVYRSNTKINEFEKEGTIIGELSMILNQPRTASIKALTDSSVLIIEGELDEIVKQYPDYSKKLIRSLAERLASAAESFNG